MWDPNKCSVDGNCGSDGKLNLLGGGCSGCARWTKRCELKNGDGGRIGGDGGWKNKDDDGGDDGGDNYCYY